MTRMPHTEKSIEYTGEKRGQLEGSADVDEMVTDWRVSDDLQLQKKTVKDGWVDAKVDEAPQGVQTTINEQKVTDEFYTVEYRNVGRVEDAFVIPFEEPLDDYVVEPVFGDGFCSAEAIEEESGKSLDELIKSELVTNGSKVYEYGGYTYLIKALWHRFKNSPNDEIVYNFLLNLPLIFLSLIYPLIAEGIGAWILVGVIPTFVFLVFNYFLIQDALRNIGYKKYEELF